ncbi:MAG TPA: hypothetical protein VD962_07365 [Rubricoccaceae bacterium]|nr:hypothetical protein [Rubricoccaceae bacterium]
MPPPDLPALPGAALPFKRPDPLDLSFEGFGREAFAVLERLRQRPHVEQVRREKAALEQYVYAPFRRYRDDLAVNWVLPNRLPFETERGVFSRILKNDFGAGGSNHHLWMAFYRPPRRRLTDLQLTHSLWPDRFSLGLFAGAYARGLFGPARQRMLDEPSAALDLLNSLLARGYTFAFSRVLTRQERREVFDAPLDALPEGLTKANGLWVRTLVPREEVLALGPALVERALDAQADLWPLYRFWAEAAG